jgi:hypothetical protein
MRIATRPLVARLALLNERFLVLFFKKEPLARA